MKLSIIIPVFNEAKNLQKIVQMVQAEPIKISKEIILIDDGSIDGTTEELKKFKTSSDLKIVYLGKNRGKGYAIRKGLEKATGDFILIQDADLEYSVKDYSKIIQPLILDEADIVYGSRFLGSISGMRWQNRLANKILTGTANLLYGIKITDEATAYKAFKKEIFNKINLKCERFEFCPEITAKAGKNNYRFTEVPIAYQGRSIKDGKKIKPSDGFEAFWTLLKYRFMD